MTNSCSTTTSDVFNNPSNSYVNPGLAPCAGSGENNKLEFIDGKVCIVNGAEQVQCLDLSDISVPVSSWSGQKKTLQSGEVIYIPGLEKGIQNKVQVFEDGITEIKTDQEYYFIIDLSVSYYSNFKYYNIAIEASANQSLNIDISDALNIALGNNNISINAAYNSSNFTFTGTQVGYDFNITNVNLLIIDASMDSTSPFPTYKIDGVAIPQPPQPNSLVEDTSSALPAYKYPNGAMLGYVITGTYPTDECNYTSWIYMNEVKTPFDVYIPTEVDNVITDISIYQSITFDSSIQWEDEVIFLAPITVDASESSVTSTHITDSSVSDTTINDCIITDSSIYDSSIGDSSTNNSYIISSYIDNQKNDPSILSDFIIQDTSIINTSVVHSYILSSNISQLSIVDESDISTGKIINSQIENSEMTNVNVTDSSILNSYINKDSSIINSFIEKSWINAFEFTPGSWVNDASCTKEYITGGLIHDSSVNNSILTDVSIYTSILYDTSVLNCTLYNVVLENSTVENSRTIEVNTTCDSSVSWNVDSSLFYSKFTKNVDVGMNGAGNETTLSAGEYLDYVNSNNLWDKFGPLSARIAVPDNPGTSIKNLINGFYLFNPQNFAMVVDYITIN